MGARRGEIYFVDFGPISNKNKAPALWHPVVVLSINSINEQTESTILLVSVVPGTSGENVPTDYPFHVRVPASASGLRKETVFRAFQITSLDSRRLPPAPAGFLTGKYLTQVENAVGYVLGISSVLPTAQS